ncbi:putative transposase (putative), gypsy type [Senna tora]|uniref:Putative transposase (Putative), gypsy type n=1 Tax=Senna tora TaxID=362788 RepID=A0A834WYV0_9FABA|nr:putative transposase (putative), gypsy type [Senna tora]
MVEMTGGSGREEWATFSVARGVISITGSSCFIFITSITLSVCLLAAFELFFILALILHSSLVFLLPWLVPPVAILLLNRHTSRNASSFPSVSISPYIRVHAVDSPMAVYRDPINEESLRASVESRPPITCLEEVPYSFAVYRLEQENFFSTSGEQGPLPISLGEGIELDSLSTRVRLAEYYYPSPNFFSQESQVFLKTAIKFNLCVAKHPFPMPLLGHDGMRFLFFVFVAEVIDVIPPFSYFVVRFLNCTNVCPVHLAPNIWVFLWGFEEICESIGVEPFLWFFFHLFQVQRRFAQDFVFICGQSSSVLASCEPPTAFSFMLVVFWSPPSVPLSGLSKAEQAAIAQLVLMNSGGQIRDKLSTCLLPLILRMGLGVIEEIPRYYKKEDVVEISRHWGKEPLRGDKEDGPRVRRRVLSSTSRDPEQEGLARNIRFCMSHLNEALSGLQGASVLVDSAKIATINLLRAQDALRQASTLRDLNGAQQELAATNRVLQLGSIHLLGPFLPLCESFGVPEGLIGWDFLVPLCEGFGVPDGLIAWDFLCLFVRALGYPRAL